MKLLESQQFTGRLNREKGVVKGVKILGLRSRHGYDYSARALKDAQELYEGIPVYVNHPDRRRLRETRRYEDRFGLLEGVHYQEGRGLYGDLKYNREHPIAKQFEWDVENDAKNVGLSHNATGTPNLRGGREVIESIDVLRSVDLVTSPATNVGLFESKGGSRMGVRVRRKNARRRTSKKPNEKQRAATALLEAMAAEDGAETKSTKQAMAEMIMAVFMNEADATTRRDKINAILDMEETVAEPEGEDSDGTTEEDITESRSPRGKRNKTMKKKTKTGGKSLVEAKLQRKVKQMERKDKVRDLCESMGLRPTATQLKALMRADTKKEAKELVESFIDGKESRSGKAKSRSSNETKKALKHEDWLDEMGLEIEADDKD